MDYRTVPLDSKHEKKDFDCGKASLNQYIKTQAGQDVKKQASTCFILEGEDKIVVGYYTLSAASISRGMVPEEAQKKMPRYNDLPVILLGRLALDQKHQGKGLGNILLADALKRAYHATSTIGCVAVVVDPLDQEAESYYARFGFIELPGSGKMFLAMKTIESLFK